MRENYFWLTYKISEQTHANKIWFQAKLNLANQICAAPVLPSQVSILSSENQRKISQFFLFFKEITDTTQTRSKTHE